MSVRTAERVRKPGFLANLRSGLKHHPMLCAMCLPVIVWFIIFAYVPLAYLLVAFKSYSAVDGLWGSKWVGLKNFEAFFGSSNFINVTYNTVVLNVMFMRSGNAASSTSASTGC